jgi:hypothetical protein
MVATVSRGKIVSLTQVKDGGCRCLRAVRELKVSLDLEADMLVPRLEGCPPTALKGGSAAAHLAKELA